MNEFRGAEHNDEAMLILDLSDYSWERRRFSMGESGGANARFLLRYRQLPE